jgi:hypothetical protein
VKFDEIQKIPVYEFSGGARFGGVFCALGQDHGNDNAMLERVLESVACGLMLGANSATRACDYSSLTLVLVQS